jgi:hypothetical protein
MRDLRCPYCFELLSRESATFRCVNPNPMQCNPEEDGELSAYQGFPTPQRLPRVFTFHISAWRTDVHSGVCNCGFETTRRVCAACHNDLPGSLTSGTSRSIALIGTKFVGKSVFITVLINELRTRLGADFNASLNALDDRTIRRYESEFSSFIYANKLTIPITQPASQSPDIRYPLLYRWTLRSGRKLRSCSLIFFDTSGEDLKDLESMRKYTRHLAYADGLIFLIDPLQIPAIRGQLRRFTQLPTQINDQLALVRWAFDLIAAERGPGLAKVPAPVALSFSKIDAIRDMFEDASPLHYAPGHPGHLDLTDQAQVNECVRTYVNRWLGPEWEEELSQKFADYAYFGVSALGMDPTYDGRLPRGVSPFRVEDPLLWLLYKLDLIEAKWR